MCPTWPRALLGLRSGAGGNAGIGERLRLSGRWGRARSRFFFATERRAGAAKERIRLPFRRMVTKRTTRALGCRCGWMTWMRSPAMRCGWAGCHFSADRHAVECPRNARATPGWARVSSQQRDREGAIAESEKRKAKAKSRSLGSARDDNFLALVVAGLKPCPDVETEEEADSSAENRLRNDGRRR